MRTRILILTALAAAASAYFAVGPSAPGRVRIDMFLGIAAPEAASSSATADRVAWSDEEVACAHTLAGPSADKCTADSCSDPLASFDGPCEKFCAHLTRNPFRTPVARKDCRARLALKQWPVRSEEVIGGKLALDGEYLSTVLISEEAGICTGALISAHVVLTAAHCTGQRIAILGAYVRTARNNSADARVSATPLIAPAPIDLALLKLNRPLNAKPLTIASEAAIDASAFVRVVGFGFSEKGEIGDKRYGDSVVVSRTCAKVDVVRYGCHEGLEFVAGKLNDPAVAEVDTCRGDSGGPALVGSADIAALAPELRHDRYGQDMAAGRYFLAAITSRSVEPAGSPVKTYTFNGETVPCGSGGRYVRLTGAALAWIKQNLPAGETVEVAP